VGSAASVSTIRKVFHHCRQACSHWFRAK
jgi:hypothetical protein